MYQRKLIFLFLGLFFIFYSNTVSAYPSFQKLIDETPSGGTLEPAPGIYQGPVTINKPLTINGKKNVSIDNNGEGTVITIETDGVTLKGLTIMNSGRFHNFLDSGIKVRGNFNVIKDNIIKNCLFGIDLQQADNNIIRRNKISSKDIELGLRGDAIRLWYSMKNKITDNQINNARDMVVWYSKNNIIKNNTVKGGRYGLHFMYSRNNIVEHNRFEKNLVGIFLMYSFGTRIKYNLISHALGPTGMGIGFKESSDIVVEDNDIFYCSTGIYLDVSPYEPDTFNKFTSNRFAFNSIGIRFHNDWIGNTFHSNSFENNLSQVMVHGSETADRNHWDGNYWDDYTGFDKNKNGVGDIKYQIFSYADRLWMDVPAAQFFRGTPVLELIDFLERLAPFSEPSLIMQDNAPLMENPNIES